MSATIKASIADLRLYPTRVTDFDGLVRRGIGELDDAVIAYRVSCPDAPWWPSNPSPQIDSLVNRSRDLSEQFATAARLLEAAASTGSILPGGLDGWEQAIMANALRFNSAGRIGLNPVGMFGALLTRTGAQGVSQLLGSAAMRHLLSFLDGTLPPPAEIDQTVLKFGGGAEVAFVSAEASVTARLAGRSDGSWVIFVTTSQKGAAEVGAGAACKLDLNGKSLVHEGAIASASIGLTGSEGSFRRFNSKEEAMAWWEKNREVELAKAAARVAPGAPPGTGRLAAWGLNKLFGDDSSPDGTFMGLEVNVEASAETTNLAELGIHAKAAVEAARGATFTKRPEGRNSVSTVFTDKAEGSVTGPLGPSVNVEVGVQVITTLNYDSHGKPASVTVRSFQVDAVGKAPSLGDHPAYAEAGVDEDTHVYQTETTLQLTDPEVAAALERVTGFKVDDPISATAASLNGAINSPEVAKLAATTVTEWSDPHTTGVEVDCSVNIGLGGGGSATATSTSSHAVALYEKRAGSTTFVQRDLPARND